MPVVKRLPHRLGIIVPSRDRDGRSLPSLVKREIDDAVDPWFAAAFGGSTEERIGQRNRLMGRFQVRPGKVVIETVKEVWAQCTADEFLRHGGRLVRLAEWVCSHGDQAAIAILVDTEMRLVEPPAGGARRPS